MKIRHCNDSFSIIKLFLFHNETLPCAAEIRCIDKYLGIWGMNTNIHMPNIVFSRHFHLIALETGYWALFALKQQVHHAESMSFFHKIYLHYMFIKYKNHRASYSENNFMINKSNYISLSANIVIIKFRNEFVFI